jgi:hypothetical protein
MRLITENTCSCPWDWAMVTADGAVRPCCYAKTPVGNLNDNSLEEIWNGRTMLEVRWFVDHNKLHSVCRDAACKFSQAKAGNKAQPHEVKDCRYAFVDVTVHYDGDDVVVAGKVVNRSDTAWFMFDDAGNPYIRAGARVFDLASGATLQDLRHPIPEVLFPNESAPFEFRVQRRPGAVLKVDVCNENEFWFEDRGEKPFVLPL